MSNAQPAVQGLTQDIGRMIIDYLADREEAFAAGAAAGRLEAHAALVDNVMELRAEVQYLRYLLHMHGIDFQGPRQAGGDWAEVMHHESTESEGDIDDEMESEGHGDED